MSKDDEAPLLKGRASKSPTRAREPAASETIKLIDPPGAAPPSAAHTAAALLLQLGTLPFALAALALHVAPLGFIQLYKLLSVFVAYAAIILAYIGGLQQAAAVSAEASPALVVAAIGLALSALAVLGASLLRGVAPADPLLLSLLYAGQALLEAAAMPWAGLPPAALMREARRAPMLVAAASLLAAAPAAARLAPYALGRDATALNRAEGVLFAAALVALLAAAACAPRAAAGAPTAPRFSAVAVGTTNACKCAAVRTALRQYPALCDVHQPLLACKVPSGVDEQPIGLPTIAHGARNRAASAHAAAAAHERGGAAAAKEGSDRRALLSLGIESGLFELEGKHYDVCVVSAFDGASHRLGLSCAFQIPPAILRHVTHGGMDLSQACKAAAITADSQLGEHEGLIGILSKGRVKRLEYTVQALQTAIFFAENDAWYPPA